MFVDTCKLCSADSPKLISMGEFNVLHCNNCEFEYIDNAIKYLGNDYFNNYYARREKSSDNKNTLRKKQYLVDSSVVGKYLHNGDSVLDVGCSNGEFLSVVSSLKNNLKCLGIDIDQSGILKANEKYGNVARFEKRSLVTLFENKFNVVIFRGTFQYLADELHESMQHLEGLIDDDAKILIFSLPSTDAFLYELLEEKWGLFHPEMSLMFNENSIHYLASMYDFQIERLDYPYLNDVYANRKSDYENVKNIILGLSDNSTAFWGSLMTVVMSKKSV